MLDLEPAAHQVVALLTGISEDQLRDPTPCPGMPVAAMLDHFLGLSLAFTTAANKTSLGVSQAPSARADDLDPRWRTLLPVRLDELVNAWRPPSAWEGTTEAGGVEMPAAQMGVVALDELVLHGWDLARATTQPFTCDPASTAAVLQLTEASAAPEATSFRDDVFGPVVPVPADACDFDRALGFAGRDPAWTPPVARARHSRAPRS